jgi:hypothetical protein
MQGNSLIELLSTESLASTIDHKRTELVKELKKAKDELFNITIPTQKENKRLEIDILMKKLFKYDRDKQIKRLKDDILAVKSQQRLFEDDKDKKENEKKIRVTESRIEEIKNIDVPGPTEHFEWYINYSEIFQAKGGFDVVIANPPYIKEDVNRHAFDGLRKSDCYQGKMDLWYIFGSKGMDVLRNTGTMAFIATNNWITNDGASRFRNKMIKYGRILDFIDFADYKIFTAGIQTMVFVIVKSREPQEYFLRYSKLFDNNASTEFLTKFLYETRDLSNPKFEKFKVSIKRSDYIDSYIKFIHPTNDGILNKIKELGSFNLVDHEIFSGIDVMQDFVNKTHLEKLEGQFSVGDGIFVLSAKEKMLVKWNDNELGLLKPYYTTKEINRYYANSANRYWVIYAGAEINKKINLYPNIKKHLDIFQKIITSVNKPYGLHRTRDEDNFLGEKILSVRKCAQPSFSLVDFPCYVSRAFLVIKTNRINLKYILGLLNSKVVAFWLFFQGKLQGNQFQVDKNPLMNIPIVKADISGQKAIIDFAEKIIEEVKDSNYSQNPTKQSKVKDLEAEIDQLVYKLYDLTPDEIKIVEGENA